MIKESFSQVNAKIRRTLEGIGGSADAYEEIPIPTKSSWETASKRAGVVETSFSPPKAQAKKNEAFTESPDWLKDDTDWNDFEDLSPPSIDPDSFEVKGTIDDVGELNEVHTALFMASEGRKNAQAELETGKYSTFESGNDFHVEDTVKGIRYTLVKRNLDTLCPGIVDSDTNFIWVTRMNDNHRIGYIHENHYFVTKQATP